MQLCWGGFFTFLIKLVLIDNLLSPCCHAGLRRDDATTPCRSEIAAGILSLAGQLLRRELEALGAGGIPLRPLLIAGHGAVTQGALSQAPSQELCAREVHPGTPAWGCCSSLGAGGQKTRRMGCKSRGGGGVTPAREALPWLQTRSRNETNYPRLQLEALGEKAFTAG